MDMRKIPSSVCNEDGTKRREVVTAALSLLFLALVFFFKTCYEG